MINKYLKETVKSESISKMSNATGHIIRVDDENNKADVFFPSFGNQQNGRRIDAIPICIAANGIHQSKFRKGDLVYVQFNSSTIFSPKIIAKADESYKNNTAKKEVHLNKGSLLLKETKKIESEEEYIPSYKTWMTTDDNYFKNNDYKEKEAMLNIAKIIEEKGKFIGEDVGLFNPISSSIVKLKDNGDIDIFTNNDIGLRVNSKDKTVEIFGSLKIKGESISIETDTLSIDYKNKIIGGNIVDEI